jgi:hypothetical protein
MLKITRPEPGHIRAFCALFGALCAYVLTIPAANLLVAHFGAVPVGFGLVAPAGVFMVGLALVLRDLVHDLGGRWSVLWAIVLGTTLSYAWAGPGLAVASAVAFAVAELADMAVYAPIRAHGLRAALLLVPAMFSARAERALYRRPAPAPRSRLLAAIVVSNTVGLAVDSLLFLHLAFGSLAYLPGQMVAKAEMTLLAVLALQLIGMRRPRTA